MQLTSLFIYLSSSRWCSEERMGFLTCSGLITPSFLNLPVPFISPMALSGLVIWFQDQNVQHEVQQQPRTHIGTLKKTLESQVVVLDYVETLGVRTYVLSDCTSEATALCESKLYCSEVRG